MTDRVRRPKQYDDLLASLKDKNNIFPTYKDALVFAACLGHSRGKRIKFDKSSEPINMKTFSDPYDQMAINVIAISATEDDLMILAPERSDERVRIFEEYACGGLEIIDNELNQGNLDLEVGLSRMMIEEQKGNSVLTDLSEV